MNCGGKNTPIDPNLGVTQELCDPSVENYYNCRQKHDEYVSYEFAEE
jgi:hypothetical protein